MSIRVAFWFGVTLLGCALCTNAQTSPQPQTPPSKKAAPPSSSSAPKKRQRVVPNWAGFDLLEKKGATSTPVTPGVVGATRGLPQAVALAPRLGKVYGLNPVFAWSFAGKASRFVLTLTDLNQTELFRQEVTGTQFQYPAGAAPLESGKTYFWTVQSPLGALGATTSAPAGFVIIAAAQRDEIDKALAQIAATDPYERDLARARVFTDHRLWYDAIAAYSDLIDRFPGRAELYEQRGQIYAQTQTTKTLSERDFTRADEIASAARKPE
jgi:hypothetical protein